MCVGDCVTVIDAAGPPPPMRPPPPPRRPAAAASLLDASNVHEPEKSVFPCAQSGAGSATSAASATPAISVRFMRILLRWRAACPSDDGQRFFFDMSDLRVGA